MLYLEGTLGSVSLTPAFPNEHVRVLNARLGDELIHREVPVADEFGPQIEAFSQAIRGGPIPPSCEADGYVDLAIIEATYGAAQAGTTQAVKLDCNVQK